MKMSKFSALVKKSGFCKLCNVKNGDAFLASRSAIFRAGALPEIKYDEQMQMVLDLAEKDWAKVNFEAFECDNLESVLAIDLRDHVPGEKAAKLLEMQAVLGGKIAVGLIDPVNEELVFFDQSLLAPVQKEIDDSHYIEYIIRRSEEGKTYVVVKDGFELIAAVMPVNIVTKEYLAALAEFEVHCVRQYEREITRTMQMEQPEVE